MDQYQQFIHKSRYARWLESEGRRETWRETVQRYIDFFIDREQLDKDSTETQEIYNAIYNLEVMPSMRCMMTAGEALKRDNVAGFNCSYLHIDHVRAFDELMYVLMCGTGVGFSVERNFINQLPEVAESMHATDTTIVVADSKMGWASAYRELISLLYSGKVPKWDMRKVRPAGARLKTFGGRASGPEPLHDLFVFTVAVFRKAHGRKLTSIECHDICCKIADIVVVGGVRRSALISLSNLSDQRMAKAKAGQWWENEGQRRLANNSVAYTEKPDFSAFISEMQTLYESKCGERGIFSRVAAKKIAERNGRRDPAHNFGTNPCSEIILRSNQFCNLSEVVVREDDDLTSLKKKVKIATIIGTLQSTLTDFRYLRVRWKRNTEEEALLGVSLTGIMDSPLTNGKEMGLRERLDIFRKVAVDTNKKYADLLNIPPSTAITCVKPSGTVSQLCDSASGIHARHSQYYIRTVRGDNKDPLTQFMIDQGVPNEPEINKPNEVTVFSFPIKSPEGSVTRDQMSAIEQLEMWRIYQEHWCEHKPSVTVTVREGEWLEVGAFVFKHFVDMSGVSFLPHSDHVYQQAPYQECSEFEYNDMLSKMPPKIKWADLKEQTDTTAGSQSLACSGDSCELVDIGA